MAADALPEDTGESPSPPATAAVLSSALAARVAPLHANGLDLGIVKAGVAGILIQNFSVIALLWLDSLRAAQMLPGPSSAVLMSLCLLISAAALFWFTLIWYRAQGRLEQLS